MTTHSTKHNGTKLFMKSHFFHAHWSLFAVLCVKKEPVQQAGFGNRGHLKALNDAKMILNDYEGR